MAFETPGTPQQEKEEIKRTLNQLQKTKDRLKNQKQDRDSEIEAINQKIKEIQAEMQSDAEPTRSDMTEGDYEKKVDESDDIKSPSQKPVDQEEIPDDVKERAQAVRKVLGDKVDQETAKQLKQSLSKSEKEELESMLGKEDKKDQGVADENYAKESFVDISSKEIIKNLPKEKRDLVREHSDLFEALNQATSPEDRSEEFDRYQKSQGFSRHDSDQRKVYDLVVKLKEKYS